MNEPHPLLRAIKPVVEDAARFRPEASEVKALVADSRLLRDASGWTPAIDLDNGVARTVDWWRARIAVGAVRATADYLT